MTSTATTTSSSSKPNFSAPEIKHRESALLRCFQLVNTSGNGLISATELEAVAKMFNPQAGDFQQETKIILNKLDLNHDNVIDSKEWVSGLFDLFRFMTEGAFNVSTQVRCQ